MEGCQILGYVDAPDQKTGDTRRVLWVDWDLRAERRRQREHERSHLAKGQRLLVACANTRDVGRERWQGVLPGSVTGKRAAMSPGGQAAPNHTDSNTGFAWKYLLINGCEASESVFTA